MLDESSQRIIPTAQSHSVQIVYFEEELDEGAKGPLGALRRRIQKIGVLDFAAFGTNLQDFCDRINAMLQSVGDSVSQYNLNSFEVTVEVTAKGEVRFIGSAGTDIKGGLKLVFQRKQ